MSNIRRWYILLVATISLHAVAWAVIALLRNVLGVWGDLSTEGIAFQVAVLVIGMPIFLIHWLWAQRLAAADPEECGAVLRRFFLYANMTALLAPMASNLYNLIQGLVGKLLDPQGRWYGALDYMETSAFQGIMGRLVALLVLGALWFYLRQVAQADAARVQMIGQPLLMQRIYIFIFSAVGLFLTSESMASLLHWLMLQVGTNMFAVGRITLIDPISSLFLGVPLWVTFWQAAQQRFASGQIEEHESVLRKFYLHATIFFSALATIGSASLILNGILQTLLGLNPEGDIRDGLSVMLTGLLIWVYHALVLRNDLAHIREVPQQAGVRRLSWYLVASIGLGASLSGMTGLISVVIRAISRSEFGDPLRAQIAWSLAALIAGLPVWIVIWRRAQGLAEVDGEVGDAERGSVVRRIYLYGFLFFATLTILGSLIYIVYQILRLILGEPAPSGLGISIAHAVAFSLIAGAVLAYHGMILRSEGQRRTAMSSQREATLRVVILDMDDGHFGRAVRERLGHEMPNLNLTPIGLTPVAQAALNAIPDPRGLAAQLSEAGLIIAPWQAALAHAGTLEVAQAIAASPAHKLLIPKSVTGWDWVGANVGYDEDDTLKAVVHAVRQVIHGEPVRPSREISPMNVLGAIAGVVVLFFLLMILISAIVSSFF
ncbi:hypothetical protein OSCT_2127 [Oscillochloris trichoides DG-6]|uniref:DUF5671 domain-containing protein n=1 Tax=Oscillochloris trichoides DG-6 TaxID=765420 RepID=E1IFM6_9CHLR|nr:DUF5671 domain-containing protein [Oscillochloris trichoides]EFO80042.1 hypothetical protein OSCT_2127 [Oscillochloris trichoides DG-6]